MKTVDLKPFTAPPPVAREACHACHTFAPECLVPVGDEAIPCCWLCAHHIVEHGASLEDACASECECVPWDIYPNRAAPMAAAIEDEAPAPPAVPMSPREQDRARLLKASPDKLQRWAEEAHKQMSNAQLAAVKKRLN